MTRWRLLETGARAGSWNMACDVALLAAANGDDFAPTLRLYGWDPPAVSIGYHQPDPSAAEAALLNARGVDWVRRPTGGRAVYHAGPGAELTYSVAAPLSAPGVGVDLADTYRRIHTAIAEGLARLGAEVELAQPGPPRGAAAARARISPTSRWACFAATVPWEIEARGRKLVGSAQRRSRRAFLQHGSIPLWGDQSLLDEIWPGSLEPERATNVSAAAGRRVEFAELAAALATSVAESLRVALEPAWLSDSELGDVCALLPVPALA